MAWDPLSAVGGTEPLYFGPLAGYDTEELDRRGIDQDKKTTKGFKWMSVAVGEAEATVNAKKSATTQEKQHLDPSPFSSELNQGRRSKKFGPNELLTWDEFTQNTTFHGIRYIFDKTQLKIRRYRKQLFVSLELAAHYPLINSKEQFCNLSFQNFVVLHCDAGSDFIRRASRQ